MLRHFPLSCFYDASGPPPDPPDFPPAGSMLEMRPLPRKPSQYFSASSWGHDTRHATPFVCASCRGARAETQMLAPSNALMQAIGR